MGFMAFKGMSRRPTEDISRPRVCWTGPVSNCVLSYDVHIHSSADSFSVFPLSVVLAMLVFFSRNFLSSGCSGRYFTVVWLLVEVYFRLGASVGCFCAYWFIWLFPFGCFSYHYDYFRSAHTV